MTEADWLRCTIPQDMRRINLGKVSDRKLRLFAVACCRRVWDLFTSDLSSRTVEIAEHFADGLCTYEDLEAARSGAWLTVRSIGNYPVAWTAEDYADGAAGDTAHPDAYQAADNVCWAAQFARDPDAEPTKHLDAPEGPEHHAQAMLLRCIVGNPFRPVVLDPAWLTPTVTNLATVAYQERALPSGELDPDCLAVLSDALEDAGCTNADILNHLRQQGPHVRGCWPVDLLLARE